MTTGKIRVRARTESPKQLHRQSLPSLHILILACGPGESDQKDSQGGVEACWRVIVRGRWFQMYEKSSPFVFIMSTGPVLIESQSVRTYIIRPPLFVYVPREIFPASNVVRNTTLFVITGDHSSASMANRWLSMADSPAT